VTRTTIVIAAALALAVTLPAVSAQAQSPRTFVSAAGSDSNPCSFAAPCRHFQAAVIATSAGGEVDALDRPATARSPSPRPLPLRAKAGPTLRRQPAEMESRSMP
jgi:hypothetical protein